jgi:hypothetical protein
MAKTWVLDTGTKGTGAQMLPLEKALPKPDEEAPKQPRRPAPERRRVEAPQRRPAERPAPERTSTPLPPGHVRKKSTGEIGRVQSVDPRAGTATVQWLKQGRSSTVPLSAITRK